MSRSIPISVPSKAPKGLLNAHSCVCISLGLFFSEIQNKYTLHPVCNLLSSQAKNHRHFLMPTHKCCASGNEMRGIYLEQHAPWCYLNFICFLLFSSNLNVCLLNFQSIPAHLIPIFASHSDA